MVTDDFPRQVHPLKDKDRVTFCRIHDLKKVKMYFIGIIIQTVLELQCSSLMDGVNFVFQYLVCK